MTNHHSTHATGWPSLRNGESAVVRSRELKQWGLIAAQRSKVAGGLVGGQGRGASRGG